MKFILNGKSLGRVPYDKLIATIDIPYEKGILEAVSYKEGIEISRARLLTAGTAKKIVLTPEENSLVADQLDVCCVHIEIVDDEGEHLPNDDRLLRVTLEGPAEFLAIGSGSPCTEDQIGATECHAYHGAGLVIFKATEVGDIKVIVEAGGVEAGICTIIAK